MNTGIKKQITGIAIFSILMASPVRAASMFSDSACSNDYFMMQSGMQWMMPLFWIMVLGILIGFIRWIRLLDKKDTRKPHNRKSAMEILKERLATGEIDKNEYEERKETLSDVSENTADRHN